MTSPLTMTCQVQHPRMTVKQGHETHAVVTLTGRGAAVDVVRPQLSVVFVLDTSGSMSGEPLQQVKDSVDKLCGLLQPTDRVGIVIFSSNPVTVAEVAPLTAEHRASIRRRLSSLVASGNTGMTAGVVQGLSLLPARGDNERQVMVLLTDGAPTDGATADSQGALVAEHRQQVATVTLGYGVNHRADLLDAVAKAGGGQYWYIPDPAEANLEFARALGAQADIVVDGVELVFRPREGVEIVRMLDGAKPRFSAEGLLLSRPDLRDGQTHTTIITLKVAPFLEPGRWPLLEVSARFRRAGSGERHQHDEVLSVDVVHGAGSVDLDAHRSVVLATAENKRAEARAQADAGRFDAAAAVLKPVVQELEKLPGYQKLDGSAVSEAVEQLFDEIVAYESRPTAQQYLEFRSTVLGVDVAQGGVHVADLKMKSASSKAIMQGVASGVMEVSITDKSGGTRIEQFVGGEVTVGRVSGNDIVLPAGNISKRHTRLVLRDGKVLVVCLKSTNGTYVNGARVSAPQVVGTTDAVKIGDFTLQITAVVPPVVPPVAPPIM